MIKGNEELYSFISRPLPLIPKKTYLDDKPRSYQLLEELREFDCKTEQKFAIAEENVSQSETVPVKPEIKLSAIVYRRNPSSSLLAPNLLNLNKIVANAEEFSTEIRYNKPHKPIRSPIRSDQTLDFESRFESGNLDAAIKVSDNEYNLILQSDVNTAGNTQWFFFRTSNTTKDLNVKFNIINLSKGNSLYNSGMQVLVHSECEEKLSGKTWMRAGESISYYANSLAKSLTKTYYSSSFTYKFLHTDDVVYFAYSCPYTYTDLMKYLLELENDRIRSAFFIRKLLCKTIGGNRCDYLSITASDHPENIKQRKGVVISARVHPGETVSSWMMQGVIDFLTGLSEEAVLIREKFVIKVIPMLNPDGVINGNYRTNLAGSDLNRKWKNPSSIIHPTVYHSKKLIKAFARSRNMELVCDLHGHSRSKGIFAYGCNNFSIPAETRVFPMILSKISEYFEYNKCSFRMQKAKEATMRIAMFKELSVPNVFTLEASFCGGKGIQFGVEELMGMGRNICLALLIYSGDQALCKELKISKEAIINELQSDPTLIEEKELVVTDSDSDPSEDNLEEELLKTLIPNKRRKQVKSGRLAKLTKFGNSSLSAVRRREKLWEKRDTKLIPIEKIAEIKKCEVCGETVVSGHACVKRNKYPLTPTPATKPRKIMKSSSAIGSGLIYMNLKGRTVRDQATQTIFVRKLQTQVTNNSFSTLNASKLMDSRKPKPDKLLGISVKTVLNNQPSGSNFDVSVRKY